MAERIVDPRALVALPPASRWVPPVLAAWLIPGAGHFLLKKQGRAALLFAAIVTTFVLGLMMRGTMFEARSGDLLTTIIYTGGFIAHLLTGLPYLISVGLNYSQADVAGHVHDYGTKFLVAAGLLNILAIVDAYDIAVGKKD